MSTNEAGNVGFFVEKRERRLQWITVLVISVTALAISGGSFIFYEVASHEAQLAQEQAAFAQTQVKLAEVQEHVVRLALEENSRSIPVIAIGPDHQHSISRMGWLLDQSGKTIANVIDGLISNARFSPDGKLVFAASANGAVLADSEAGKIVFRFPNFKHVTFVTFSPDGRWLVVTLMDYHTRFYNVQTGEESALFTQSNGEP